MATNMQELLIQLNDTVLEHNDLFEVHDDNAIIIIAASESGCGVAGTYSQADVLRMFDTILFPETPPEDGGFGNLGDQLALQALPAIFKRQPNVMPVVRELIASMMTDPSNDDPSAA